MLKKMGSKSLIAASIIFFISIVLAFVLFALPTNSSSIKVMPEKIHTTIGQKGSIRWNILKPELRGKEVTFTSDNPNIITIAQIPEDKRWEWQAIGVGTANITLHVAGSPESNKVIPITIVEKDNTPVSIISSSEGEISTFSLMATDVVTDPELKRVVNESLGRPVNTPVTQEDMEGLTSLYYYGPNQENSTDPRLTSLEGLQYATNLEDLTIMYADLGSDDSLVPIENLQSMKYIYIHYCKLNNSSLYSIGNLRMVESLFLGNNYFDNLTGLTPLFQAKLDAFRADPEGSPYFSFYTMQTPIVDFTGALPYYQLSKERDIFLGASEEQALWSATNSTIRGTGPYIYDLAERLRPDYETYAQWGNDAEPITLPDIWSPRITPETAPEKNRIVIKDSTMDMFGDKMLFSGWMDWRQDKEDKTNNFTSVLQLYGMLYYASLLANGGDSSYIEDPYGYFTFKERDSIDNPGEKEYYYEGRDFNVVPYNPNATGPENRQDPIILSEEEGYVFSVYYIELKNFNDPVPNPDAPGMLPNIFKNTGDTTTAIFTSPYFITGNQMGTMNSSYYTGFRQIIHWFDPSLPVIEGLVNQSIDQGTNFNLLTGLSAFDPTKDQDNPDGLTPKNLTDRIEIIDQGGFDINKPGSYVIKYKVISPYNMETTGERIITVVKKETPVPPVPPTPSNDGKIDGGTLPSTGSTMNFIWAISLIFAGIITFAFRRRTYK